MSKEKVGQGQNYETLVKEYARIQTAAYTDQSAKSADIAKLRERFASYFESGGGADTSQRDKMLGVLDGMVSMAREHEDSHGKKTSNAEWDKDRKAMDSLLKDLAPKGTSVSILATIPQGGSRGAGSGSTGSGGSGAKLEGVEDGNGAGYSGNLNDPSASKDYKGLSIDQLLKSNSPIGEAMRKEPQVVEAIRKASQRTGVPAGLMAATAYAESSFGLDAATTRNVDGDATVGIFQGSKAWMDKYNKGGSLSNIQDNVDMFANAMVDQYHRLGSWGGALRAWNSSGYDTPLPDAHNLSKTNGAGDADYVSNILGMIAMGHPRN